MQHLCHRKRRAAAAVELAVLLPMLLFLFVIAVDFGRILYFSQIIENCARQGAQYASDAKAPSRNLYTSLQAAALADAADLSPQPTVTSTTGTDSNGSPYVAVTVSWQFSTVTNFLGVPKNVTLSRTVQARTAP
jgi:Flp pilus assembly protein TadG